MIVVDQGSTDGTPKYLQTLTRKYDNVVISLERDNLGFAGGCNKGASLSNGHAILFLNNDCLLGQDAIRRLVNAMELAGLDAIGPISNETGEIQRLTEPYDRNRYTEELVRVDTKLASRYGEQVGIFHRIGGFCMLVRRDKFESVGGFSLQYGVGYYEDDDLCYRLKSVGAKIGIARGVFVHHHGSRSFKRAKLSSAELMARNRLSFVKNSYYQLDSGNTSGVASLVSVIIATYNRPQLLQRAIESVLYQDYGNVEIVVVRDGGTSVRPVIDAISSDVNVVLIDLEENVGKSRALNIGMERARGDYIAYLDDDDFYLPDHIKILVSVLEKTGAEFAYSDSEARIIHRDGKISSSFLTNHEFDIERISFSNYIPNLAVMHRNRVYYRHDEALKTIEDWDFLKTAAVSMGAEFVHVPVVTNVFFYREDNTTRNGVRFRDPRLYFEILSDIRVKSAWWIEHKTSSETLRISSRRYENKSMKRRVLQEAYQLNPANLLVQLELADILVSQGELEQAREVLAPKVFKAPQSYHQAKKLIEICDQLDDFESIISLCEFALLYAPNEEELAWVYRYMSRAYSEMDSITASLCYGREAWLLELRNYEAEIAGRWSRIINKIKTVYSEQGVSVVVFKGVQFLINRARAIFIG